MAFRMAGYQHRIWERHLDMYPPEAGHRPLPLIIPIVIYQGRRRWTAPTDLAGLLDVDPELSVAAGDLIPRVFYLLDDLTVIDEHEMRARPLSTAARLTFVSFENAPATGMRRAGWASGPMTLQLWTSGGWCRFSRIF